MRRACDRRTYRGNELHRGNENASILGKLSEKASLRKLDCDGLILKIDTPK
jgi:hypothetical protein